ncbi:hypothetical protein PCG10_002607 [Penicillium crustosum]|uniref:Metallo-beta-lactamase domain-containing protein n=2 Tax=Penicillium crustosum TaxID=36656 RepID=A0A9P5GNH1_PENCR|nr:hypothetical protein PCG10_002607 [Penicillium crustosum]
MGTQHRNMQFPPGSTVEVSVIDTTTYLTNIKGNIVVDPVYPGYEILKIPSFSFLIHHPPSGSHVLFDLGLRKNWRTHLSPHLLKEILAAPYDIHCTKDVADILAEHNISPDMIDTVIFSHHHWDHVGDTTRFPSSTRIMTGPGYKAKYLPGWPIDPAATETTSDLYADRELIEINFEDRSSSLNIHGYQAYDYFGDGSFYLLNAPGHTTGHLNALVRTTSASPGSDDTFILLGADTAHHCSVLRPSAYCPLPGILRPAPASQDTESSCSSKKYLGSHRVFAKERDAASTISFCQIPEPNPYDEDIEVARQSLDKLVPLDGTDNVFTIFSHDDTLADVIDFFPGMANEWKAKEWKARGHWKFLAPLRLTESIE